MKKIRIGILFGGQSAEHEVSIRSAKNVYDALDKSKYDPVLIGISKKGDWLTLPSGHFQQIDSQNFALPEKIEKDALVKDPIHQQNLDVVFPVLHGPMGEDGTVQGMLKLFNIPFVGASVLGSAVGMDKDVAKRLLRDAGIPIVKFITLQRSDVILNEMNDLKTTDSSHSAQNDKYNFEKVRKELGLPFFIKPANLGSSVGVSKVHSEKEFRTGVNEAFRYDRKILIEKAINAREIECSVLGNEDLKASVLGEIIPHHEFYDYEAKYIDGDGAGLQIPAKLAEKQVEQIQELAIKTCKVLGVEGMARVDFFLDKDTDKIYVNEVNTIPGFTSISMYPKMWEASGISYSELIDRLIELALERYKKESQLVNDR